MYIGKSFNKSIAYYIFYRYFADYRLSSKFLYLFISVKDSSNFIDFLIMNYLLSDEFEEHERFHTIGYHLHDKLHGYLKVLNFKFDRKKVQKK